MIGAPTDLVAAPSDAGRWRLGLLLGIVLVQTALVGAYRQRIPVGEGPDEATHIEYSRHLLAGKGLPTVREGEAALTQATHPPLYYALGAVLALGGAIDSLQLPVNPFFSANLLDPAPVPNIHLPPAPELPAAAGVATAQRMRLLSLACAWVVVLATCRLVGILLPGRPALALAAAATIAWWPPFLFASAVFSNDMGANAAAAVALAGAAHLLVKGAERHRVLTATGAALGVGLLSKLTVLGVVPIVGAAWLLGRRRRPPARSWGRDLALLGLPVLLIFGWWPLRNMALYGLDQPLGGTAFQQVAESMVRDQPFLSELPRYLSLQFQTLIGRFGWVSVLQPAALYRAWAVLLLVILSLGVGRILLRGSPGQAAAAFEDGAAERRAVLACVLGFLPIYLVALRLALSLNLVAAHARYFFAGLPLLATLLVLCWAQLWPRRAQGLGLSLLPLGVLLWSTWVATEVIAPAYATPPTRPARSEVLARFGEWIVLRGIRAEVHEVPGAGSRLDLTLRMGIDAPSGRLPADERGLLVFAQVVQHGDHKLGQVDAPPFGGRFPFEAWPAGKDLSFGLPIDLEEGSLGGAADLLVGVYPEDRPEARLGARDGEGLPLPENALRLGSLPLAAGSVLRFGSERSGP